MAPFGAEVAAGAAYDEAAVFYFGEHTRPNFLSGVESWLEAEYKSAQQRLAA